LRHPADVILERRAQSHRSRWAVGVSVVLHGSLLAAAIFVPQILAGEPEPVEFVIVDIVPLQALGRPEPEPEPEPVAEPEPEPPPRPAPPPEEAPTLPAPKPAPKTEKPAERRPPAPPEEPKQRRGSAFGSATGTAAFGAQGVGLDNPDFTYGYYVEQMLALISNNWARPPAAGRIEAVVHYRIARDGTVSEIELLESSGDRAFDDAALTAVRLASPLPPLPASFNSDSLGVRLRVQ
jgi:protein TonB